MNQRNYQKELDRILTEIQAEAKAPRLFLHSCCAPCSSYVLEYLSQYFEITVYYYNPNIFPAEEYDKRVEEERRLIESMEFSASGGFNCCSLPSGGVLRDCQRV